MRIMQMNVATGERIERDMTPEEIAALPSPPPLDVAAVVDAHIEGVARSMDYKSGAQCAGYFNSTVPQWAAEAAEFLAWRDAVWLAVFAHQGPAPATADGVIAMLPTFVRPVVQS